MINKSIQIEKGVPGNATVNSCTSKAYISYPTSNFILVVNLNNGSIDAKIPANSPGNIVVNSVTNKVYVSSAYGICEIDGIDNQYELINIGLPHWDGSVDINPLTNLLYTTCFGHDILTVIDTASQSIVDKIPVGKNPKGVAVDIHANKIYVANYNSSSVSIIDCYQSNQVVDSIIFGKKNSTINPKFVLVNESSEILYVITDSAENWITPGVGAGGVRYKSILYVVDTITKEDINSKGLAFNSGVGFAFNHGNNGIYMMKPGERSVLKLDESARESVGITTLDKPSILKRLFGMNIIFFAEIIAVNPLTNKVYVSDSENNLLYEIDG